MTLYLNLQPDDGLGFAFASGGAALAIGIFHILIVKTDQEIVVEVARMLYPGGALASLTLSFLLMVWLDDLVMEEGNQHIPVLFVGFFVAGFLILRCWDIKWLRNEEELQRMEEFDRPY